MISGFLADEGQSDILQDGTTSRENGPRTTTTTYSSFLGTKDWFIYKPYVLLTFYTDCQTLKCLSRIIQKWHVFRLARRGLPHQDSCPFCNQSEETINHILLGCVFARMVWHEVCTALGRHNWVPTTVDTLVTWCQSKFSADGRLRDHRTILVLVCWELWKHRNGIVFDGESPSSARIGTRILEEGKAWPAAGLLKGDMSDFFGSLARWVDHE